MRCINPFLAVDKTGNRRFVGCGKCPACLMKRKKEKGQRIMDEASMYNGDCCVISLTYDDEHLPADMSLHKEEFQLFMKRFRKALGRKVRYFMCGEYGDSFGRPHYHCILFGVAENDKIFGFRTPWKQGYKCQLPSWQYGFTHIMPLNIRTANYVAGYVQKKIGVENEKKIYEEAGLQPPFILFSTKPGLGYEFARKHAKRLLTGRGVSGEYVRSIPRYYKDKLGIKEINKLKHIEEARADVFSKSYQERAYQYSRNIEARRALYDKRGHK